jgi:hypothetical protein
MLGVVVAILAAGALASVIATRREDRRRNQSDAA